MNQDTINEFSNLMAQKLRNKYKLNWDTDKKGVVCGWCTLDNADDIVTVAEIVAGFKGRIMTISSLVADSKQQTEHVEINYHFYFGQVNCTVCIKLPDDNRKVKSITPLLKSADWHEREMKELFNIEIEGHPNPKRLFLDESIQMNDNTMIPLSEAMNGASTNTLWEKLMESKEAKKDGQL